MSDKVASLYADIGFKVDKKGVTEAQTLLKNLAEEAKKFNNALKSAAAKGLSGTALKKQIDENAKAVKDGIKQEESARTENAKNEAAANRADIARRKLALAERKQEFNEKAALAKQELQNQIFKHKQENDALAAQDRKKADADKAKLAQDRLDFQKQKDQRNWEHKLEREEQAAEAKAAREQQRLEERQNKEAEKAARERQLRLKRTLGAFREFGLSLANTFVKLAGLGAAGVAATMGYTREARNRAVNVRDFQFETGVGFNDLQRYRRGFTAIGSNMQAEDIMSDLMNVQQNLTSISLGKGNLSGYKLAGVRASAESGSSLRVMESLRQVAQDRSIDNAMMINIMRDMGIKNARDWLLAFRSNIPEDDLKKRTQITAEQEQDILNAQIAIRQFDDALTDLKENITSELSPVMKEVADTWRKGIQEFILGIKSGELKEAAEGLKELAKAAGTLASLIGEGVEWYLSTLPKVKKATEDFIDKHWKPKSDDFEKNLKLYEKQNEKAVSLYEKGLLTRTFMGMSDAQIENLTGRSREDAINYAKAALEIRDKKQPVTSGLIPDKVSSFNMSKVRQTPVIYYNDHHTVNSTVNGVPSEDIADTVIDNINQNDRAQIDKTGMQLSEAGGLYLIGSTVGGV